MARKVVVVTIDYDKIRERIGGFERATDAEIDNYLSRIPDDQKDKIINSRSGGLAGAKKKKESSDAVSTESEN